MIQARDILKSVLEHEPNHSGALHYLIHAYDVAQIDIAEEAIDYILTYQKLVTQLSYPQHLPAHIWMRTGSILLAKSSDETSIKLSLTLCLIKITGRTISISSTELETSLAQLNTTVQISSFLLCDAKNRAFSTEWLSFSRLQTGDWLGTLSLISDLYIAYKQSIPSSNHYLSYAYRSRARAIVNIFYWLPYDLQFINKVQELYDLDKSLPFVLLGEDTTNWDLAWSEAGYRLSECLRLLTANNVNYIDLAVESTIDEHTNRFAILSNQTISLNKYISTSISLMMLQIRGIIYFKNESFQECLNIFNDAAQREFDLVIDNNSPTLIFARSSELLAMHLLLIHRKYQDQLEQTNSSTFILNGTQVLVSEFPRYALNLYRTSNLSAPNRAINILGVARAYSQLRYNNDAVKFYRILLAQINSSNNTDPIFSQEAIDFIIQKENLQNSANNNHFCYSSILISFFLFSSFFFIRK